MDTEKYRVLLQTLKEGSLSKTADKYGYTVSGISRLITALEREQGFALLQRMRDGVKPSKELEELLPYIQEWLYQEDILLAVSERIRGAALGTITLGVAYSSYYQYMADMAKSFQKLHPSVKFEFVDGYSSELLEKLKGHQLDICLISERNGSHEWKQIGDEEIVAWVPENHRLSSFDSIPLDEFSGESYIDIYPGKDIDNARLLKENAIKLESTISVQDSFAAYSMVDAGLGVSLNHKSNCRKWNGNVLIKSLDPKVFIAVGLAKNKKATLAADEFWNYLQENKKM